MINMSGFVKFSHKMYEYTLFVHTEKKLHI